MTVFPKCGGRDVRRVRDRCRIHARRRRGGVVRVIARRPDAIIGFGETRVHAETATFEVRASEIANPRPGDQLMVGGETFVLQGEPERRDSGSAGLEPGY